MKIYSALILLLPGTASKVASQCHPIATCSTGNVLVLIKNAAFSSNGCGTATNPIPEMKHLESCCDIHDACYQICGIKKKFCDTQLKSCMAAKCKASHSEMDQRMCTLSLSLFEIGMETEGCKAFQNAQQASCECVHMNEASSAHREGVRLLLRVIRKGGEMDIEKEVDDLLAKYKGRESDLYYKLLKKYPHAIQKEKTMHHAEL